MVAAIEIVPCMFCRSYDDDGDDNLVYLILNFRFETTVITSVVSC